MYLGGFLYHLPTVCGVIIIIIKLKIIIKIKISTETKLYLKNIPPFHCTLISLIPKDWQGFSWQIIFYYKSYLKS